MEQTEDRILGLEDYKNSQMKKKEKIKKYE
jgi:hypothetical protein